MRMKEQMIPGIKGGVLVAQEYVSTNTFAKFAKYANTDTHGDLEYALNSALDEITDEAPMHLVRLLNKAIKLGAELLWIKERK